MIPSGFRSRSTRCGFPNGSFGTLIINKDSTMTKSASAFEIGGNYLIRTVTMIDTGRVVAVNEQEIVLEDAAWIADTGRFATALKTGDFSEVEPFPSGQVIIGRGAIIDAVKIPSLPSTQK
ncbi:hypothetical protein [Agrobacterium vitis]|uniref:hypothetical protein n=1 Tax=Agrobacterium vitis TaxID=373 RepID=UPI0008DC0F94|nr:hypothetical protein [Agrobacterium vitis]MUO84022.1 hypothetical protein [Agrobacterium vitis]